VYFSYNLSIEIEPDFDYLTGILLLAKLTICDWTTWDSDRVKYVEDVLNLKKDLKRFHVEKA
jgi:hypothetical protein